MNDIFKDCVMSEEKRDLAKLRNNQWKELLFRLENNKKNIGKLEKLINLVEGDFNQKQEFIDLFIYLIDFKTDEFSKKYLKSINYKNENEKGILEETYASKLGWVLSEIFYDKETYKDLIKCISLIPNENLYSKVYHIKEDEFISKDVTNLLSREDVLNEFNIIDESLNIPFIKVFKYLNVQQIEELNSILIENNNLPENYLSVDKNYTISVLSSFAIHNKIAEAVKIAELSKINIYEDYSWILKSESWDFVKGVIDNLRIDVLKMPKEFMSDATNKSYSSKLIALKNEKISPVELFDENAINLRNLLKKAKKAEIKNFLKDNEGKINFQKVFNDYNFTHDFFEGSTYWIFEDLKKNNSTHISDVYYGYSLLEMILRRPKVSWKYKNMFFDNIEHVMNEYTFSKLIDNLPNYYNKLSTYNTEYTSSSMRLEMAIMNGEKNKKQRYVSNNLYNNNLLSFYNNRNMGGIDFYNDSKRLLNIIKKVNIINDGDLKDLEKDINSVYTVFVPSFQNFATIKSLCAEEFIMLKLLNKVAKNIGKEVDYYQMVDSVNLKGQPIEWDNGKIEQPKIYPFLGLILINSMVEASENKNTEFTEHAMNKAFSLFTEYLESENYKQEKNIIDSLFLINVMLERNNFSYTKLNDENKQKIHLMQKCVEDVENFLKSKNYFSSEWELSREDVYFVLELTNKQIDAFLMKKDVLTISNNQRRLNKF